MQCTRILLDRGSMDGTSMDVIARYRDLSYSHLCESIRPLVGMTLIRSPYTLSLYGSNGDGIGSGCLSGYLQPQ